MAPRRAACRGDGEAPRRARLHRPRRRAPDAAPSLRRAGSTPDGTHKECRVEDHAWRLYRHMFGGDARLPDYFVTALEISADAHQAMVAAVAPFIDTSISKTVNVAEDYPYAEFEGLYMKAWKSGLKGLATYRPNQVLGAVLTPDNARPGDEAAGEGANRRLA